MSILLPSTIEALRTVSPRAPMFSNQILAELFEAKHTRGPFKLLPSADGGYIVFDTRAPLGMGALEHHLALVDADAALERIDKASPEPSSPERRTAAASERQGTRPAPGSRS